MKPPNPFGKRGLQSSEDRRGYFNHRPPPLLQPASVKKPSAVCPLGGSMWQTPATFCLTAVAAVVACSSAVGTVGEIETLWVSDARFVVEAEAGAMARAAKAARAKILRDVFMVVLSSCFGLITCRLVSSNKSKLLSEYKCNYSIVEKIMQVPFTRCKLGVILSYYLNTEKISLLKIFKKCLLKLEGGK